VGQSFLGNGLIFFCRAFWTKQRQGRFGDARPQDRIIELPCPPQPAASFGEDLDGRFAVVRNHANGDALYIVICHRRPGAFGFVLAT